MTLDKIYISVRIIMPGEIGLKPTESAISLLLGIVLTSVLHKMAINAY